MNARSITEGARAYAVLPPSALRFIAAFAAVALSFIGATAYSQHAQRSIGQAAAAIAGNAAPSIEHMGKARTELRQVQLLLHDYTYSASHDRPKLDEIARSRERYARETEAYLALPPFPGEQALWADTSSALLPCDEVIGRTLARLEEGDFAGADQLLNRELPAAADRAFQAMSRSLDLNVDQTRVLAESIESTRNRALFIERALDTLGVALAAIAALLLFRTVRQYAALREAHLRLTEERADELELFAARVAHDILSPLGATGMALAIADKSLPEGSKAREAVARGAASLARVRRIVDGLLDFARAGAQPAPDARADVAPVVDDVVNDVRAMAAERGVEVTVEPFAPCAVACSPGILTSLLANLLRNAVKYMDEQPVRRVSVRVLARGERVRFEVVDTGPGIPEHLREGVFNPYVRAATSGQPGIGLGLATVKRVTQTHGGEVGVSSSPGRGSLFWFELPRPHDAVAVASAQVNAAS